MSDILLNREWLSANAQRRYPIAEQAYPQDTTNTFLIPDALIVGLRFAVHAGLATEPGQFFISRLTVDSGAARIVFSYQSDEGPIVVAFALIPIESHTENAVYQLVGQGDFSDTTGHIVIGTPTAITSLPVGDYSFTFASTRLEVDAIHPYIQAVSAFSVISGTFKSQRLYGDLELVAGPGIRLSVSDVNTSNPKVRIDVVPTEDLLQNCVCTTDNLGPPIRTIVGIPPTAAGDFTLAAGTCVKLTPVSNGLRIDDECSKPCCGCPELTALAGEIKQVRSEHMATSRLLDRLGVEVSQITNVILGSRLNDGGCLSCSVEP